MGGPSMTLWSFLGDLGNKDHTRPVMMMMGDVKVGENGREKKNILFGRVMREDDGLVVTTLSAILFGRVMREDDGFGSDDSFGCVMRKRGVLGLCDTRRECHVNCSELCRGSRPLSADIIVVRVEQEGRFADFPLVREVCVEDYGKQYMVGSENDGCNYFRCAVTGELTKVLADERLLKSEENESDKKIVCVQKVVMGLERFVVLEDWKALEVSKEGSVKAEDTTMFMDHSCSSSICNECQKQFRWRVEQEGHFIDLPLWREVCVKDYENQVALGIRLEVKMMDVTTLDGAMIGELTKVLVDERFLKSEESESDKKIVGVQKSVIYGS
ncbi:hypothetical protein V8G54_031701 [Vigna mungo]|uniref:Uncharacterized protein n=1 Tax=Vigna mungo TaxID=3915 RepID=A0AAQ3RES0_VIGMU